MSPVGGDLTHISTKLFWFLGFCISVIHGDGCEKVTLSNTMFHESLEGTYLQLTSLCAGRNVYRQQDGKEYLFYRNMSGKWHGWMVGDESCIENHGIIVETKAYYPEEATEIWQEWYFENWYYSKLIEVKCTNKVSTTTLIGVTILGLLILVVVVFTAVRCRSMMQRRQLAPQPVPRTQISTVTPGSRPRVHNTMQLQPRYPGPHTPRPLRPHGPQFAPPPMRPGFGHGPMMPSGYGPNPRMPPYNPRAMVPPGYLGYSGPLAPAYPDVLGPPPPYKPPPVEYPDTAPAYPPPEVSIHHGQQQYSDQQQQQQRQQQQRQFQQQQQQQMQRQSSEGEKEAGKKDESNEERQVHSVQSLAHGHADNVENHVTADVAD